MFDSKGRFIVVVLDGFGIGEMPDVKSERPQDIGANTAYKLLDYYCDQSLPTLEMLGLNNIVQCKTSAISISELANVGTLELKHLGCDTFAGHQEIMGTKPTKPLVKPFCQSVDKIESALKQAGYKTERVFREQQYILWIEEAVAIGDNLEAELGQVYNISANFNQIDYSTLQDIGKIVRENNDVARNIVFGGLLDSSQKLLDAIEVHGNCIGVNAPKSGVYDSGFQVEHLGYGVDSSTQVPEQLNKLGIKTTLIGKVADIVANPHGVSHKKLVNTDEIFAITCHDISQQSEGFFCINVQETDLSGHKENHQEYWDVLEAADRGLQKIIQLLNPEDVLLVTADHGNDPFIGHGKHTREKVPVLVYTSKSKGVDLGNGKTLANIGATVCDFFSANPPQYGQSFLPLINKKK
ncbi:phosphopentomutase [Vibrio aestuarianus]|uniref:Phosphopentomutase n=1 Tax=Vibrio aestuarianus TaxID=28171 RepID=A0A9X4EXE5_9VIBR|nr:phosphopentomutase [Vibrio aestuarianus]MDE1242600.1 phosphopentomutase [Vibrio aestuarianus]